MATTKQVKAAQKLVENGGNVSRAMREAGYSPNTAKTPTKLTESVGFLTLMDDIGLSDGFILGSLMEDIRQKPGNRKPELELAFRLRGRLSTKTVPEPEQPLHPVFVVDLGGSNLISRQEI